MGKSDGLLLTPAGVLPQAKAAVSELESLVAGLESQRAEAEVSDFGNAILADRLRGQVLPGINRDLHAARDKLARIRDCFIPMVEKELARDPGKRMSLCDSQCLGESLHCIYCRWD